MTDPESGLLGADEPRLFPLYPGRPASSSSSVLISFLLFFGGWVRGGGLRGREGTSVFSPAPPGGY